MQSLRLCFVGSGDAFSSGGRLQSGIFIAARSGGLLLDCGATLLAGLQRSKINTDQIDCVAISHLHGDHFSGIPFLLLDALFNQKRRKPLQIIGPPGIEKRVTETCKVLYPGALDGPFPFLLSYQTLEHHQSLQQGFFTISALPASHGQHSAASLLRIKIEGKLIAYTGDTEWTEVLPELSKGSDLLICECCNYAEKIPSHLDYLTLKQHRHKLDSARIILTHTGTSIDENRQRIELEIARDGLWLEL